MLLLYLVVCQHQKCMLKPSEPCAFWNLSLNETALDTVIDLCWSWRCLKTDVCDCSGCHSSARTAARSRKAAGAQRLRSPSLWLGGNQQISEIRATGAPHCGSWYCR